MFDRGGSLIGYIGESSPDKDPDKFHVVASAGLSGYPNPHFDDLERSPIGLGI